MVFAFVCFVLELRVNFVVNDSQPLFHKLCIADMVSRVLLRADIVKSSGQDWPENLTFCCYIKSEMQLLARVICDKFFRLQQYQLTLANSDIMLVAELLLLLLA